MSGRYGHETGDELLKYVAEEDVEGIAKRIITAFETPKTISGYSVRVTTSVGTAIHPVSGLFSVDLIRMATMPCRVRNAPGKTAMA